MSRRNLSSAQDPEVEDSRAELDMLEGHKRNAHGEIQAAAENKKRLEADFAKTTEALTQQIADKRKQLALDEAAHARRLEEHATEERAFKARTVAAQEEALRAEKDLADKKRAVAEQNILYVERHEAVTALTATEKRLRDSVAGLEPRVRILEKKKRELERDCESLAQARVAAELAHGTVLTVTEEAKQAHEKLVALHNEKKAQLDANAKELSEVVLQIAQERATLTTVQKERAEHEEAMRERESAANERMANATRLETRVNDKLEQLKEIEQHFTTEHLSRIGYKKIGT